MPLLAEVVRSEPWSDLPLRPARANNPGSLWCCRSGSPTGRAPDDTDEQPTDTDTDTDTTTKKGGGVGPRPGSASPTPPKVTQFHGTKTIDPTRAVRDISQISDEILALFTVNDVPVQLTVDIESSAMERLSADQISALKENLTTLGFTEWSVE
jgi:hypothetical protein